MSGEQKEDLLTPRILSCNFISFLNKQRWLWKLRIYVHFWVEFSCWVVKMGHITSTYAHSGGFSPHFCIKAWATRHIAQKIPAAALYLFYQFTLQLLIKQLGHTKIRRYTCPDMTFSQLTANSSYLLSCESEYVSCSVIMSFHLGKTSYFDNNRIYAPQNHLYSRFSPRRTDADFETCILEALDALKILALILNRGLILNSKPLKTWQSAAAAGSKYRLNKKM